MPKKIQRSFSVLCILWLILSLALVPDSAGQQQKNFLWKVQSRSTIVYILGSIHFLRETDYPLNPTIEVAFKDSKVLAVEANITDPGKLNLLNLLTLALYPENDSIEKHISRETSQYAAREAENLGLPFQLIQRQRPWFLALSLETLGLSRLGYDPMYGIDLHFLTKAKENKRIVELESMDEQINLLSSFSDTNQELLLLYTLKNLNILGRYMTEVVKAWKTGDAKSINAIVMQSVREDPRLAPILRKLLDDRNVRMVSKIEGYMRTGETHFVVVGAGHLIGDRGIITMLRQRGHLVQQL